jgi:hypothetical protein
MGIANRASQGETQREEFFISGFAQQFLIYDESERMAASSQY